MNLHLKDLQHAVEQNIINQEQAQRLWALWQAQHHDRAHFDFTHILYYLGGFLAIGAMSLFMNLGWERFGGWGIVVLCMVYAVAGLALLHYFQHKRLSIPAGITAVFVVALTPLAVYGLQQGLGVWPADDLRYRDYHHWIEWHWLYMELATLAVAAIMLHRYRYPFLVLPVAFTLWYLSMDTTSWLANLFYGGDYNWQLRKTVSVVFGLFMLGLAVLTDLRSRNSTRDYPFWLYVFGALTFWGGLTAMESASEWGKLVYCLINLAMIITGAILVRRVFVVLGGMGVAIYITHLAEKVFKDSWLFPISLTFLGLLVICAGIAWQKHEARLTKRLQQLLPSAWQRALPHNTDKT